MKQYFVTGMSCAACQSRVERAVLKVEGVTSCAVSLLTNSMGVEGTAEPDKVIEAVTKAGYGAHLKENAPNVAVSPEDSEIRLKRNNPNSGDFQSADEEALRDTLSPRLLKHLIASLVFLLILMYFSMGHMLLNLPLPAFLEHNPVAIGLLQLLLTIVIMMINKDFFISGFRSMLHLSPNMDALVALGSTAAFVYSTVYLFVMTGMMTGSNENEASELLHELYFESAAMILTLITVGKLLEARAKGRTTNALKGLMRLAPRTANVLRNGIELNIPIEQVTLNDVFRVRPGERIPVDGEVIEGSSAIDESSLTGESIPVEKTAGSLVSAGTLNQSGTLSCRATRVGEDTTLAQIIRLVSESAATKAPIARIADRVSGAFVPVVMGIALITFVVWLIIGSSVGFCLARAISVLVISCPCALGLATPVAIMVGNGVGARNGILFKTSESLEQTGRTKVVVLDKTGTITAGLPEVTDIIPAEGVSESRLLREAYSLEILSEHPLGGAIVRRSEADGIIAQRVEDFEALPGAGLAGNIDGKRLWGGSFQYMCKQLEPEEDIILRVRRLAEEGKTPLLFGYSKQFLGMIAVADTVREDSPAAITKLHAMGIRVVMLTGDNERTAAAIAKQAGIDEVIAGVLPQDKDIAIRRLKAQGTVMMVGDGINDAPALTGADIGVAIGAGADVAVDAADVVLMKNTLQDVPAAIELSRATLRNIRENLFWAFIYNAIGIPLAAGVFINLFGWKLNPMFGALAMSLSSFCVVSNALRLNLVKIYGSPHSRRIERTSKNSGWTNEMIADENTLAKLNREKSIDYGNNAISSEGGLSELNREKSIDIGNNAISSEGSLSELNREKSIDVGNNALSSESGLTKLNCETDNVDKASSKKAAEIREEQETMQKTLNIEGMMCGHCEKHVKDALEAISGVVKAEVSHEKGTAIVTLSEEVDEAVLKEAVVDQGYTVR